MCAVTAAPGPAGVRIAALSTWTAIGEHAAHPLEMAPHARVKPWPISPVLPPASARRMFWSRVRERRSHGSRRPSETRGRLAAEDGACSGHAFVDVARHGWSSSAIPQGASRSTASPPTTPVTVSPGMRPSAASGDSACIPEIVTPLWTQPSSGSHCHRGGGTHACQGGSRLVDSARNAGGARCV
jgi:hypothetical protein